MLFLLSFVFFGMAAAIDHAVIRRAFTKAMGKCALSLKETAGHQDRDPRLLQRELDGVGHVSLTRIVQTMPPSFVQWFALELVAEVGLPSEVQLGQTIAERAL